MNAAPSPIHSLTSAGNVSFKATFTWVESPSESAEVHQLCNALYCLFSKNHRMNGAALKGIQAPGDLNIFPYISYYIFPGSWTRETNSHFRVTGLITRRSKATHLWLLCAKPFRWTDWCWRVPLWKKTFALNKPRHGSNVIFHMRRIECKWAKSTTFDPCPSYVIDLNKVMLGLEQGHQFEHFLSDKG